MRLTTLIVDDEPLAREGLRLLLASDPDVAAIDEAANGREAVAAIRDRRPDLVFLDVQMPEMDGFAVLEQIGGPSPTAQTPEQTRAARAMPAIVFVTAHDQYAIRAFEINAIDYLLKPVTSQRFTQALARAKARLQAPQAPDETNGQLMALLETIASPSRFVKRLAIRATGKTLFVNVDEIDWMRAAENYVELHVGRAHHLLHVTMSTLERSLDPELFLRIHRSIIVNVRRIQEVEPAQHGEYVVRLHTGTTLQSGRTYHDRIKALIANPF